MPIEMVWSMLRDEAFDVKQFASGLLDRAQENLRQDGYVQPAVFLITADEVQCWSLSFNRYQEKETTYDEIVKKARELNAEAIVTLNDAFVGAKYDPATYEWGQAARDPKGECIFVTVSGPDLENWTKEIEHHRETDGIVFSRATEERQCWSRKGQRVN
jgi:hypothetical protein